MLEENNETMIIACYQPRVTRMANTIFNCIDSYSEVASEIIGGMGFTFRGLNKEYLTKQSKKFRGIDLTRYEAYINMYENGLRKIYNKKDTKDGE